MTTRAQTFTGVVATARLRRGAALMGVCNVTPDSFSDGGRYDTTERAIARVDELVSEGADIVDVGGESTKPGAPPVPAKEQLRRVLDVIAYAAKKTVVSIDTTSPEVAAACLDAGAVCVNDVSCLADEGLARVAGGSGAALVISHARGLQGKMADFGAVHEAHYRDVVRDVAADLLRAKERALACGIESSALVLDPGLGFTKSARHSMDLLRRLRELSARVDDTPLLVGASRKSFLTLVDRGAEPGDRIGLSIIAAAHAVREGASIVRVHDVRATRQAIDMSIVLTVPAVRPPRRDGGA